MKVHQLYTESPLKNFNYFIEYKEGEVIAVDPLLSDQVEAWATQNKKKISVIIITHEHLDHINAKDELKRRTGAEVWAHESCKGVLKNIDRYLKHGEKIQLINDAELDILHTPGHTKTHICLLISQNGRQKSIITMDTVFNAGVGNCKQGGDPKTLFKTIVKLNNMLDENVKLYPGHDYILKNLKFTTQVEPGNFYAKDLLEQIKMYADRGFATTISQERGMNTFFRLDSKEIRENLDGIDHHSSDEEVFLKLRELRDKF